MNKTTPLISPEYLEKALTALVQINSINPDLSKEGVGEEQISAYIAQELQACGMQVDRRELAPGRFNVIGVRKGRGGGKSLLWNAHMDTVGSNGMEQPFKAEVRDGRLYGRGSQDMKGSLAAMLAAARALEEGGAQLGGDVIFTGVSDEEYASLGTEDLARDIHADAGLVLEPTEQRICPAHRGFILFDVEVFGKAAHGSRYMDGVDAILHMGRFLNGLESLADELITRPAHPLVGPPSLHASIIQGGTEASTYPAYCRLELERRTCPGESVEQASAEIQKILDALSASDPKFNGRLRATISRPAFEIDPQAEIVACLTQALAHQLGKAPVIGGATFWTDAALLAEAGIPCVVFGPTGAGLHSAEEWVDLQSCCDVAQVLMQTTMDFCS